MAACVQRNVKPVRSPKTPEVEQGLVRPASMGSPGQVGSRLSGQREPAVTTPEQLQQYLVPFCPDILDQCSVSMLLQCSCTPLWRSPMVRWCFCNARSLLPS